MSAKRFIHDPIELVDRACLGLLSLHPGLSFNKEHRVIFRKPLSQDNRVTVLSGGGSGHEPAHAGYVGEGMLDAAVCGAIFASPNVIQIESGLESISSPNGTLVIIKNYTGDKLNFGLAVEKACAKGAKVKIVLVGDDVAIGRTRNRMVGRRGLAGCVIVHKIAGAAAAAGENLDVVSQAAAYAAKNLATIGVGLDGCDVPGQQQHVNLSFDEIELGMGIHNEPGSRKMKPQPSSSDLIKQLLSTILDNTDPERNYLPTSPLEENTKVVLLVNNLGGLSVLELTCLTNMVTEQLSNTYQITPCRVYAGTFLSALNGSGFSITLLCLPFNSEEVIRKTEIILSYLDATTTATGWTSSVSSELWKSTTSIVTKLNLASSDSGLEIIPCNGQIISSIITSINTSLLKAEPQITAFDTMMGDGDCGTTLVAGSSAISEALSKLDTTSLSHTTLAIADLISKGMGGTSGALYAIYFSAFAASARDLAGAGAAVDFKFVAQMASTALAVLQKYTAASVGDRTMMDALIPFIGAIQDSSDAGLGAIPALEKAVDAARKGCEATKKMVSVFGRGTYVATEADHETAGIPDPGACGIVAIGEGILKAVKNVPSRT